MSNHLLIQLQRQHILLSYFKTLSVGPVWGSNPRAPAQQTGALPTEPTRWRLKVASVRHFGYSRSRGLAPGRVYFDDAAVFRQHRFLRSHQKTAFSKSIVFKSLHSGGGFRMAPFSVIVFGDVMWTIAVSGAKQLCFRFLHTLFCPIIFPENSQFAKSDYYESKFYKP